MMVGEEPEHLWFQMRHLVSVGRVSSGPRRSQILDTAMLYISERYRESMGRNLVKRWDKMLETQKTSKGFLNQLITQSVPARIERNGKRHSATAITIEYLKIQAGEQRNHYKDADPKLLVRRLGIRHTDTKASQQTDLQVFRAEAKSFTGSELNSSWGSSGLLSSTSKIGSRPFPRP